VNIVMNVASNNMKRDFLMIERLAASQEVFRSAKLLI
jgi:hypothetical protein